MTPVNYVYDQGHVFIRTSKVSQLLRKVPRTIVAFEVDEVDRKAREGWSVVVTGPCEIVTDSETLARVAKLGLEPWAAGDRNVVLQIATTIVTGYRIAGHGRARGGRLAQTRSLCCGHGFARRPPHRPHRRQRGCCRNS